MVVFEPTLLILLCLHLHSKIVHETLKPMAFLNLSCMTLILFFEMY